MQLRQALTSAVDRLESADVGSPRLNAEVLLMFVLGVNRAYLYAHPERELNAEEESRYDDLLAQRSTGMPSQYITGHQEFWGLDFIVSPAVLIPRPETEHLVETVLELARDITQPKIVDVGTGSGCIALALAHELKDAQIYAVDASGAALEIARANAARLQLEARVHFARCNVLQPFSDEDTRILSTSSATRVRAQEAELPAQRLLAGISNQPHLPTQASSQPRSGGSAVSPGRKPRVPAGEMTGAAERRHPIENRQATSTGFRDFDFVVSNPPYVGFGEADKVQKSVRDFEPRMAVFAGEQGLDVIAPLVQQAHEALEQGGWLAVEIGYSMRDAVLNLLSPTMWGDIRVVPDLQGIPRVVAARKE